MKKSMCVCSFFFQSTCYICLPTFCHSVKERTYVLPPEVFLITTGAENRTQAGGLPTVLATLFR